MMIFVVIVLIIVMVGEKSFLYGWWWWCDSVTLCFLFRDWVDVGQTNQSFSFSSTTNPYPKLRISYSVSRKKDTGVSMYYIQIQIIVHPQQFKLVVRKWYLQITVTSQPLSSRLHLEIFISY